MSEGGHGGYFFFFNSLFVMDFLGKHGHYILSITICKHTNHPRIDVNNLWSIPFCFPKKLFQTEFVTHLM